MFTSQLVEVFAQPAGLRDPEDQLLPCFLGLGQKQPDLVRCAKDGWESFDTPPLA